MSALPREWERIRRALATPAPSRDDLARRLGIDPADTDAMRKLTDRLESMAEVGLIHVGPGDYISATPPTTPP